MPLACLANTSLAALLAAKARPVGSAPQPLCLEHDQTVGEALAALNSRGVLSAPLLVFPTLDDGAADGGGDWDGGAPTYLVRSNCSSPAYPAR